MELIANALPWVQIILSVLLVGAILLQRSSADTGGALGSASEGISSLYHTKRGLEKMFFNATIFISLLFAASAFIALVIK